MEFLGVHFDHLDEQQVVAAVLDRATSSRFAYVVTPNVDHLVQLDRRAQNDELRSAYAEADLCLCDSRILQSMASWSDISLPLVTGSDLTAQLLEKADSAVRSICVIGGNTAIFNRLEKRFPFAVWRFHEPPMGVDSDPVVQEQIMRFVEQSACDLTFFAIGAPRSELICHRLARRGSARGIALCIGASLEFVTGAKVRAPLWMQHLKLEWLFRLAAEPRRLARRYLVDGPKIFKIWFHWRKSRSGLDV